MSDFMVRLVIDTIIAGNLQHQYQLSLGDSIVAATGIHTRCKYIISNDPDFDRIRHLVKRRFLL